MKVKVTFEAEIDDETRNDLVSALDAFFGDCPINFWDGDKDEWVEHYIGVDNIVVEDIV